MRLRSKIIISIVTLSVVATSSALLGAIAWPLRNINNVTLRLTNNVKINETIATIIHELNMIPLPHSLFIKFKIINEQEIHTQKIHTWESQIFTSEQLSDVNFQIVINSIKNLIDKNIVVQFYGVKSPQDVNNPINPNIILKIKVIDGDLSKSLYLKPLGFALKNHVRRTFDTNLDYGTYSFDGSLQNIRKHYSGNHKKI